MAVGSRSGAGFLARLKARAIAASPEIDLDFPGYRVARTPEGVVVEVDAVAYRRGMRRGGAAIGVFFAFFALLPFTAARVVAALGVAGGLALAFAGKPRDDRLVVGPTGIVSRVKGRPPRDLPASAVVSVRLAREEVEVHDGDGSHRRVDWPVYAVTASGTWQLGRSTQRERARAFAEDAAIALGRPFVDATGDEPTAVAADDVDLPFVERARLGGVAPRDPGAPPPGVERRLLAEGVEFAARRRSWSRAGGFAFGGLWFVALGSLGTVFVAAAAWNGPKWPLAFALFPLLFVMAGVVMLWGAVRAVTGESYVRVERDSVVYGSRRAGREKALRVAFADFEDVQGVRGVLLVSDARERDLGFDTVPPAAQRWIAGALKAEIARR